MDVETKTLWRLAGEEVGSCNCDWGCPCQFNAVPTHGSCQTFVAWRVDKGHYGELSLDGAKFAILAFFPGAVHEGNGTLQVIIDETAAPEQRDALLGIWAGKVGGGFPEIIAAVCPTALDPIFAPITFEADREKRRATFRVPNIAESLVEPIKNPVTGEEHRARIQLPAGFEYKEAEMGNTVRFKVTSSDSRLNMEHADSYAQLNAFDWSNL